MKKKYIIITTVTLVMVITFITYFNYLKNNRIYKEENVNKSIEVAKSISMMLEQTAGAGDYKTVTQSKWPTEGYKFNAELSRCENGSTLSWDDTKKAIVISGNLSDKCYVYFDIFSQISLVKYVISQYTGTQGENGIYYHNSSLANGAGDNSYRYAGASDSVNNYICLGSNESSCPDANLFRIIGVFGDKTKVIRAKSTGARSWNSNTGNVWSTASMNTYLNGTYLTSLGTLADKIATTTWKVGGGSWTNIGTSVPKTAYQYEVGSNSRPKTYEAKIGLMYVTDYYYGASSSAWTLVGYNSSDATKDYRAATSINWLYLGSDEWTISRTLDYSDTVFAVMSGRLYHYGVVMGSYEVRPSFNLESSVTYISGIGTMSDPIRIN